jgi:hypothetical protein
MQIQHDKVGRGCLVKIDRLGRSRGRNRLQVVDVFQNRLEELHVHWFIVDDEDAVVPVFGAGRLGPRGVQHGPEALMLELRQTCFAAEIATCFLPGTSCESCGS